MINSVKRNTGEVRIFLGKSVARIKMNLRETPDWEYRGLLHDFNQNDTVGVCVTVRCQLRNRIPLVECPEAQGAGSMRCVHWAPDALPPLEDGPHAHTS